MKAQPSLSVIIPTYNRKKFLLDTLSSLAEQTLPASQFEVIVVDDGSMDGTNEVQNEIFPFQLRYIRQANQGDALARNTGVLNSQADYLVFLDDDILVAPDYLNALLEAHDHKDNRIIVGTEFLWLEEGLPGEDAISKGRVTAGEHTLVNIPYVEVCSNNMSIVRSSYLSIGMMSNLGFSGSSMWCDVDFTHRAHKKGFTFHQSLKAVCWHRDYVVRDLDTSKKRNREASYRAVVLFQKYPELSKQLPMFADMLPIDWREDSYKTVARKVLRFCASMPVVLFVVDKILRQVGRKGGNRPGIQFLTDWLIGGYIYWGYREGLRELTFENERLG